MKSQSKLSNQSSTDSQFSLKQTLVDKAVRQTFPSKAASNDSSALLLAPDVRSDENVAGVHVKMESLAIVVVREGANLDIRADWKRLKWDRYLTIGDGIRRIVALYLDLDPEAVTVNCSLFVRGDEAVARLSIDLPDSHRERLASVELQLAIEEFSAHLMGRTQQKESIPEHEAVVPRAVLEDLRAGREEESAKRDSAEEVKVPSASQVLDIAREVRAIVGGCTLGVPCEIESPAWEQKFDLLGKLAPKPRAKAGEPKIVGLECHVEGFKRGRRVVFLSPVTLPDSCLEVNFDEDKWLSRVHMLSSPDAPVCRAKFEEVRQGQKVKRTLLGLAPTLVTAATTPQLAVTR